MNTAFSKRVTHYSFLLSLLVVWIHSINTAGSEAELRLLAAQAPGNFLIQLQYFLSVQLAQIAVPGYFLLSGYLFYRTLSKFSAILKKWRSRIYSLLLPYGAWCVIWYLLYVLFFRVRFSLAGIVDAVEHYRYFAIFWFLYQLILLTVLAPVFYPLLKNRWIGAFTLLLSLAVLYLRIDFPYLNEDAVFYYLLGGFFARHLSAGFEGKTKGEDTAFRLLTGVVFVLFLCHPLRAIFRGAGLGILETVLLRSTGALLLYALLPIPFLPAEPFMKHTLFLYAVHYPVVRALSYSVRLLSPQMTGRGQFFLRLLLYLLLPAICVAAAHALSRILKRYTPQLYRILTGGRE